MYSMPTINRRLSTVPNKPPTYLNNGPVLGNRYWFFILTGNSKLVTIPISTGLFQFNLKYYARF